MPIASSVLRHLAAAVASQTRPLCGGRSLRSYPACTSVVMPACCTEDTTACMNGFQDLADAKCKDSCRCPLASAAPLKQTPYGRRAESPQTPQNPSP